MGVKISLEEVKNRLHKVFGSKYEYDFSNFENTHSKIGVKCQEHGWNQQTLKNLFKGHGCRKCSYIIISDKQKNNFDEILNKFKEVHGNKYDYSKFIYTKNRNNSTIICPKQRDKIKEEYCKSKGIKLIVIKQDKKHIDIKDAQSQIDNIKQIIT